MATTASTALRAATDVRIVLTVLIASMTLIVLIVSPARSCLRNRRNDRQSENDGSDEDGLAKNVSSRRVGELKRAFHCHCSSLRARNLAAHDQPTNSRGVSHSGLYLIGGVAILTRIVAVWSGARAQNLYRAPMGAHQNLVKMEPARIHPQKGRE